MKKTNDPKKKKTVNKGSDGSRSGNRRIKWIVAGAVCIAAAVFCIVRFYPGKAAESDSEGDIFSRGFDKKGEMSVITEEVPESLKSSMNGGEADEDSAVFAVYEEMHKNNPDFAGYIRIEGTKIDYPVMYSPEEPEKYLDRDINVAKSSKGLPFIDARCKLDPVSDNLIIYGHNMKDGSMFGTLSDYGKMEYCKEHPIIKFDTIGEMGEYEVMFAFYDKVYYNDEPDYRFYDFIDVGNEDKFNKEIDEYRNRSIYDTGVKAHYGDKLITLVTCSYQEDNGRFVVMARKKS